MNDKLTISTAQLRAWMLKHHYSIPRLASELGISPRQVSYYRSGEWPVPRAVALALKTLGHSGVRQALPK